MKIEGKREGDPARNETMPEQIGKYRIERVLGCGGASTVYLATDLRLQKPWALKQIRKGKEEQAEKRLQQGRAEIEVLRALEHPALPRIVDVLEDETAVTLVMDYVEGETLEERLLRKGPVSEKLARNWMQQLAGVLAYLHAQRPPLVYRDMKPANVICKPNGSLMLLDFGIARTCKPHQKEDTHPFGTRGYAPPEQYGQAQTDPRADLYALGVTMVELLTGIPPDQGPSVYSRSWLRRYLGDLSASFRHVLEICLSPDPAERYPDGKALWDALQKQAMLPQFFARNKKKWRIAFWCLILLLELVVTLGRGAFLPVTGAEETETRLAIQQEKDLRFQILQEQVAFLQAHRQGFALGEIPKEEMLRQLEQIEDYLSLPAADEAQRHIQEELREEIRSCRTDLQNTYAAIEKWKRAETKKEEEGR